MRTIGRHAVVMGASVAGLLAARVLADAYERVTVLDRDELTGGATARKGVPQGRHVHGLLPAGLAALDDLFPGFGADLAAAGAPTGDGLGQFRWHVGGHRFRREPLGVTAVFATRPFLEAHIRARAAALANVDLVGRCDILGITARDGVVDGVRVLRRQDGSAEEVLRADLVVDCTGRGSRTPVRLRELGFAPPPEERTRLGVGYASRLFRLPPGTLGDDRAVLVSGAGDRMRGGAVFAVEGGRWLVTLGGYLGDHPPTDGDGFTAFARSLLARDIYDAIRAGEPLSDPVAYTYPTSLRRRYEALRSFPPGLLVMGDAVASFNPIYGQGMTVASLEACELRRLLARGTPPDPRRFFAAIAKVVDVAWDLALGADLSFPQVEGERTRRIRLLNRYVARVQAAAAHDPVVAATFVRVSGLVDPPQRLMAPGVAWRVLRAGRRRPPVAGTGPALHHRVLEVNGIRTPVLEAGDRTASDAVVFVHGNPGPKEDWSPSLAAVGGFARAVAWDHPGYGDADRPLDFDYTVDGYARQLGATLDALGIARAHLVLHDFGGPWGLRWAARHPERFASVVLINTGAMIGYRWHTLARIWRTPVLGEVFMATTPGWALRAVVNRNEPRPLPAAFFDRVLPTMDRRHKRAVRRLYRSVDDPAQLGEELATALRPLDRPALVVWGRRDAYLPEELAGRQRQAFPGARIEVLDGSGHWPFVDDPDRVVPLVTGFLAEVTNPVRERSGVAP